MREAVHLPHRVQWRPHRREPVNIAVIGCGGTGSILAEMLCRLLIGTPASLLLVDPDTIEAHNLLRQNFHQNELGQPKARALAQRLSNQYQRSVAYSQNDCRDIIASQSYHQWRLTVSCVDNALARAAIDSLADDAHWILDTGNGRENGQVLLGNITRQAHFEWQRQGDAGYYFASSECHALPSPATQQPDLLAAQGDDDHADRDCAQAVMLAEQSPLINQAMALTAAQFIYKLLTDDCRYMGVYLDLAQGQVRSVAASPANAARCLQVLNPEHLLE